MVRLTRNNLLAERALELGFQDMKELEGIAMLFRYNGGGLMINVVGSFEVFYNYESEAGFNIIKGASAIDYSLETIIEHFKNKKLHELW